MGDTYTYGRRDIMRYINNEMSAEQMHAFERAMMDDPFLADAFEGYRKSSRDLSAKHLDFIENQLRNGKENSRGLITSIRKTGWWRVAALFVLLGGAGILYMKMAENSSGTKNIAQSNSAAPSLPSFSKADSVKPLEESKPVSELLKQNRSIVARSAPPPLLPKNAVPSNETLMAPPTTDSPVAGLQKDQVAYEAKGDAAPLSKLEASTAFRVRQQSNNLKYKEFKGKVLDNNQKPLAYANVVADSGHIAVTDLNGNFAIKAPDSILRVNVSSIGYASVNKQIYSDQPENKITLKESLNNLDEVVVVGYGSQKKLTLTQTAGKAEKETKSSNGAEPEGGWENFQDYVYRKLKRERDTSNTYISGDVLVEFDIDERGKPKDVVVQQQTNKETADKAVEIIEKGPRWKKNAKSKKARVLIKF